MDLSELSLEQLYTLRAQLDDEINQREEAEMEEDQEMEEEVPEQTSSRKRLYGESNPRMNEAMSLFNTRHPEQFDTVIVVEDLSKRTGEIDVERKFRRYGPVIDVRIPQDRRSLESLGRAYVVAQNRHDAEEMAQYLNGTELDGRLISVYTLL